MKRYRIAILGASGAVGREMLKVLEERSLPIASLKLLASRRSAGKTLLFQGQPLTIEEADEHSFDDVDIVLGAAENDVARRFVPIAVAKGAIVIDNSSAYRLDEEVPLVIPEVNAADAFAHHGIIANPNCATIIALVALNALHDAYHARRMIVSTYQAVSGAGIGGIGELETQMKEMSEGRALSEPTVFPYPIACNLIPQIGGFDELGYSSEEMKMQNEGRKILHEETLRVNCTCVRVPVLRSHSESITVEFEKKWTLPRPVRCWPKQKAYGWWTTRQMPATRCRWIPAIRIWSSSGACGKTSVTRAIIRSPSGAAAIRSARALPPMPCRSQNCSSREKTDKKIRTGS